MRFTTIYQTSQNFTPTDLMYTYARLHRGVTFVRDKYMKPYILRNCTWYEFDHWEIENGSDDGSICVTVYLKEKKI